MVAEGEDWKSVEVPVASGSVVPPASSKTKQTEESEQPSGGNSNIKNIHNCITIYNTFKHVVY